MSYILDALRRADAERERGAVPGLQSQQHTVLPDDDAPERPRLLVWAVVGLSLALVAAIAWNFLGREATPPARPIAEGAVSPPPPAPAVPPAPTVLPSTAATPATTGSAPLAAAPTRPTAATPAARATTPPATAAERRASTAQPPAPTTPIAAESRRSAARSSAPPASGASGGADNRVYAQAELPEAIRREIPKLSVGGASYSNDAASRMLIINGQVFHEGDRIAPGLELERIRLRSAVLSFKGYRYELSY
jgi:general secretion pathway protein B